MFGKLMKHDFIDTWKVLALLNAVIIITGAVVGLSLYGTGSAPHEITDPVYVLKVLLTGLYILLMPSIGSIAIIYIGYRYYRTLYSSQGYLTFTLPATTGEVLCSKMLVAFIYTLLNVVCIVISITLVIWGFASWTMQGYTSFSDFIMEILQGFGYVIGDQPASLIITGIVFAVSNLVFYLMTFFFAISLGQLWQKHRILGAIVSYFGLRIVFKLISAIFNFANTADTSSVTLSTYDIDVTNVLIIAGIAQSAVLLLVSAAMYLGCYLITKHKLNLE